MTKGLIREEIDGVMDIENFEQSGSEIRLTEDLIELCKDVWAKMDTILYVIGEEANPENIIGLYRTPTIRLEEKCYKYQKHSHIGSWSYSSIYKILEKGENDNPKERFYARTTDFSEKIQPKLLKWRSGDWLDKLDRIFEKAKEEKKSWIKENIQHQRERFKEDFDYEFSGDLDEKIEELAEKKFQEKMVERKNKIEYVMEGEL